MKRKPAEPEKQEIVRLFDEGVTIKHICQRFHRAPPTVVQVLRDAGRRVLPRGAHRFEVSPEIKARICDLYRGGMFANEIARLVRVNRKRVGDILIENGIDPTTNKQVGEKSGMWKGGVRYSGGYKYVLIDPSDPFYCMTQKNEPVVAEHRLVMARHLGRPLYKWETVHHIDGDRQNNDISNLQLRFGHHGPGQTYCCADCGSRQIMPVEI